MSTRPSAASSLRTRVGGGNRRANGTSNRRLIGRDNTASVQAQQHQGRPALHLAIPIHSQQLSAERTVTARRRQGLSKGGPDSMPMWVPFARRFPHVRVCGSPGAVTPPAPPGPRLRGLLRSRLLAVSPQRATTTSAGTENRDLASSFRYTSDGRWELERDALAAVT